VAGEISRQNGRKGGRPTGSKTSEISAAVRDRIAAQADALVSAQLSLALGVAHLYRRKGGGSFELVTDADEIGRFLNEEVDREPYRYVAAVPPDNRAIDSLLNRGLGKPTDQLEVTMPVSPKVTYVFPTCPQCGRAGGKTDSYG
jgi:hypothetical protein